MLRALIWKEWREQRQVAAAGIGMAVLLPAIVFAVAASAAPDDNLGDVADLIPFLMAVIVWPLFAALAGATTNAEATAAGSLDFLMSRPVSRTRVWIIKVFVAGLALISIVVFSFWLTWQIGLGAGNGGPSFPFTSDPVSNLTSSAAQVTALGFVAASFAAAIFFSAFGRRQMITAIYGIGGGIAMTAGTLWTVSLFSADPRGRGSSGTLLAAVFLFASLAILGGALYVFRAGGTLAGAERRRAVRLAAAGIAVVFLVGMVASANLLTWTDLPEVRIVATVPGGAGVIVRVGGSTFSGRRYGLAAAGQPVRLLTDRFAVWALPSPAGDRLFYATRGGPFGFRRAGCELRVAFLDGSDDRRILPGVPCSGWPAVSPDGSKIATIAGPTLSIASLETGGWLRQVSLRRTSASPPYWPLWIDDTRILVLERIALVSVDATTGEVADLYAPDGLQRLTVRSLSGARAVVFDNYRQAGGDRNDAGGRNAGAASRSAGRGGAVSESRNRATIGGASSEAAGAGGDAMIARIDPEPASQDGLSVIELATGRVTAFPRCPRLSDLSLSPDGDRVYYPDCPNDGDPGGRLRVHDFGSGEDVVLAELDGRLDRLLPSPAGSRLLVRVRGREQGRRQVLGLGGEFVDSARLAHRYLVVDVENGGARRLEQPLSWQVHGWLDEDRLVVWRGSSRERSIALLDVDTGEIEVIAGVGQ
ncbi:MAG TPA: hypothetical protein VGD06_13075 [Acidobacteriota bacterium]